MKYYERRLLDEIRRKKELKEFTQAEFAERMGVSDSMLALLKSGKRNMSIGAMTKMANALGWSLSQVFADGPMPRSPEEERWLLAFRRVPADQSERLLALVEAMAEEDDSN